MLTLPDETVALLAVAAAGFRMPGVAAHHGELYSTHVRAPPPLTPAPAAFGPWVAHLFARATSTASVEPAAIQQGDQYIGGACARMGVSL